MFHHILIPTDGSPLADRAIRAAMEVAQETGARVTGFHALRPAKRYQLVDTVVFRPFVWREDVEREVQEQAAHVLNVVLEAAAGARVDCETVYEVTEAPPYRAIIRVAETRGCDLIIMASHDREGIGPTLVGSEATKVLKHCRIPVLVLHEKPFMGAGDGDAAGSPNADAPAAPGVPAVQARASH